MLAPNVADVLFLSGGVIGSIAPWIQIFRIWKLGKADVLSAWSLIGILLSLALGGVAALMIKQTSLVVGTCIPFVAWVVIFLQKLYYK